MKKLGLFQVAHKTWIEFLEGYNVFYSAPLDLDMEMLAALPDAYKAIIPEDGGPSLTPEIYRRFSSRLQAA